MASLSWLHLSDWHQKGRDFDRKVVRDALLRDLRERRAIDPGLGEIAFVVFSGDLAWAGRPDEYVAAREGLLDPVLREVGVSPSRLVVVPGNHDLDRDALDLVPKALSAPLGSTDDVHKWLTDDRRRRLALQPFDAFRGFVDAYTRRDAGDYANLVRLDAGDRAVAILGLNSAWMCGRHVTAAGWVDDFGKLVLGEAQIHEALEAMSDADIRIVALHHPWEWLAEWDRERVEDRIHQAAHFVLSGHVHRPKVKFTQGTGGDCVEIPAGASYDRRVADNPRYTNAYNLVHLDLDAGRGTVFLRRWSEARGAWIEDVDACAGGRYGFGLPKELGGAQRAAPAPVSLEARVQAEALRRAEAERRYRKLLLETCDIVSLVNLPEHERQLAHRQLELRRLYVPLRVRVEATGAEQEEGDALWESVEERHVARKDGRGPANAKPPREQERVTVGERLAASRRLIVLGDPGAGKTTLTRWIATAYLLRLASEASWKDVPDVSTLPDRDLLPIIVRCRDLDPRCLAGHLDDMLDHTLRKAEMSAVEAAALKDVLRERLQEGKALLLLDGLDEINEPTARARFCDQLEQIAVAFPDAPVIATSRVVGYREMGRRLGRGFEHLTLADLDGEEKDDFVRRWCALTELPERRESAAVELIHDIHSSDRIERMTGNPMLLTTMALVKRKVGKLPNRRADLYQEAVEVLLRWRTDVDTPLDPREAIPQLEYVAYAMCDRGVQRLRRDEVLELLVRMRAEHPSLHAVRARAPEEFLQRVEARTGLMMESGRVRHLGVDEPVYEFRHLTFQEYLAARALVDRRFPGWRAEESLADQVSRLAGRTEQQAYGEERLLDVGVVEAWREALRLCVTICPDHNVDTVLQAIVTSRAGEERSVARARAALGALCVADEPNASAAAVETVMDLLAALVDPADGLGVVRTAVDAAAMELVPTRWAPKLRRALVREFCERDRDARAPVGALLAMVAGLGEAASAKIWLSAQIKRLRGQNEEEAIEAALGVMHATFSGADTVVSEGVEALLDRLSGSAAMAHAASWALWWMRRGGDDDVGGWQPSYEQAQRLIGFIGNRDSDPWAVRYLSRVLKSARIQGATEPLIAWLDADPPLVVQIIETLGEVGGESAVPPLIVQLNSPNVAVRTAAVDALGEIGSDVAVQPLIRRLEDPHWQVRTAALRALVHRSREERVLLSKRPNGQGPLLDPQQPIADHHVARAAAEFAISADDARARYEALAKKYNLRLAWRPTSS